MDTSRRTFLNWVIGASGLGLAGSMLYPLFKYLSPPRGAEQSVSSVVAAHAGELKPNSGKIFKFGSRAGLLVMTPAGQYKAFSATCTHLNCIVQYREDMQHIWCACHNGQYDLQGKNIAGPPPRPLEEYDVQVKGGDIVVLRRA